jgi:hypothetical protein
LTIPRGFIAAVRDFMRARDERLSYPAAIKKLSIHYTNLLMANHDLTRAAEAVKIAAYALMAWVILKDAPPEKTP